jgi:pimeloyl-ACP methyl ester carboxylesterase
MTTVRTATGRTVSYDDAGTGPSLVLLHGFPLCREMWKPQIGLLQAQFRLIVPDLPGFGDSSGLADPPSVAGMADAVAEFLDAIGVRDPVALGGLSMGGYVALAFARKYPTRLRALILADSRAEPDDETGKANREKMIAFATEHTAADVIDQMMPKMISSESQARRADFVNAIRLVAAKQSVDGIIAAVKALRDRPDAGPGLANIIVPTLVIVGSEDTLTPPAMSHSLADRITGARLVTIPGAGHISNMEKPAEFAAAMRDFLVGMG